MFVEFHTAEDSRVAYNVKDILFVGEAGENASLMFADGSFVEIPDKYIDIAKRIAAKAKRLVAPAVFAQFSTKKEERIAYNLYRVFLIEEYESGTVFVFDDGTRLEALEEYDVVMERIAEKIDKALKLPNESPKT